MSKKGFNYRPASCCANCRYSRRDLYGDKDLDCTHRKKPVPDHIYYGDKTEPNWKCSLFRSD